jgi:carbamoyl-phosphate synthase large subunit
VDPLLGPEMRSTGEVMGSGAHFGEAFAKALAGAGMSVPTSGGAFISVRDVDKPKAIELARVLAGKGFRVVGTHGTASAIRAAGIACESINKVKEGRPHCVDLIKNGEVHFIANTTDGKKSIEESRSIRASAIQQKVCYFTTMAGALAAAVAMDHLDKVDVNRLQDLHRALN